jgi:hypothetical protein
MDQTEYEMLTTALIDWRNRGIEPRVDEAGRLHLSPRRLLQPGEIPLIEAHRDAIIAILRGAQPGADEQHQQAPVTWPEPEPQPEPTTEALSNEQSEPAIEESSQATTIIADEATDTIARQQRPTPRPNVLPDIITQIDALARDLRSVDEELRAINPMTILKCGTHPDAALTKVSIPQGECPHRHPVRVRVVRRLEVIDEQATIAHRSLNRSRTRLEQLRLQLSTKE